MHVKVYALECQESNTVTFPSEVCLKDADSN